MDTATPLDPTIAARQQNFPNAIGTRLIYWVQNPDTGRWKSGVIRGIYEELTEESRQAQRPHMWIGDVGEYVIRFCDADWRPLPHYERLHVHEPDAEMLARWQPEGVTPK